MEKLIKWLRRICAGYAVEPVAVYRRYGNHGWPLTARDENELEAKLEAGGHFLALPKEPAALANVIEVSLVDFLLGEIASTKGVTAQRGTERGYPDVEITGNRFGGGYHALDVKVARRHRNGKSTQSRITLYTGNTYFRFPKLHWPQTFRPFDDYESHLDLVALYTLNESSKARIEDLELIVQEAWRIGSRQRSSTTREYIGAVQSIRDLREGRGEFESAAAFYGYWRRFNFRIGRAVQQQLDKLIAEQAQGNQ